MAVGLGQEGGFGKTREDRAILGTGVNSTDSGSPFFTADSFSTAIFSRDVVPLSLLFRELSFLTFLPYFVR